MTVGTLKFDDSGWKRVLRTVESMGKSHVRIGVFGEYGIVAATHEFGSRTRGIPERSFMRLTFMARERDIGKVMGQLTGALLAGRITKVRLLNVLGEWIATAVKKAITDGPSIPPPNSPATIKRKGSSRTLVDTGRLVNEITFVVVP